MRHSLNVTCYLTMMLSLCAARASAQYCAGAASFAAGPVRLGAGLAFSDDAKFYAAHLAVGAPQGAFASASIGTVDLDEIDEGSTVFGVNGGYAIRLEQTKPVEFCPVVGFAYASGPDFDDEFISLETSARWFGIGGAIGGVVGRTASVDLVPFAEAVYTSAKVTVKLRADGESATESETEDFVNVTGGLGFVVNRVVTIRPTISYPFGIDDADPTFGISFAVNLGAARSAASRLAR
ncbi:MAG: hypothetical protein ACT4R6_03480 [Gemmatimonadaceae bacterium]